MEISEWARLAKEIEGLFRHEGAEFLVLDPDWWTPDEIEALKFFLHERLGYLPEILTRYPKSA